MRTESYQQNIYLWALHPYPEVARFARNDDCGWSLDSPSVSMGSILQLGLHTVTVYTALRYPYIRCRIPSRQGSES